MPICLSGIRRTIRGGESKHLRILRAHTASCQWLYTRPHQVRLQYNAVSRRYNHTYIHAGTVCIPDGSNASIKVVLDRITPVHQSKLDGHDGDQTWSLLLLVTPGLAQAVRKDSLPVRVVQRILANRRLPFALESVTGVVDAIPEPFPGHGRSEGITYALCSKGETPTLLSSTQLRSAANKPGSLSFQLGLHDGTADQLWQMQLPLSQTIFSTGLTSTLVRQTHRISSFDISPQLLAKRYLESLTFRIPDDKLPQLKIDQLPLLPLTSCQIVKNSMGNIIRTVTAYPPEENEREEPASKRLESAVTAYFEALTLPPEPVNVWALIIPRQVMSNARLIGLESVTDTDTSILQSIWLNSTQQEQTRAQYSTLLLKLLQSGGRLVKVLSGGGGWGKKAGLLSLDPDLEYSTRELRDDFGWSFDFDDASSDSMETSIGKGIDQALGQSVEEGDGLIFMIGQKQNAIDRSASTSSHQSLQLRLGTCRPLEDAADKVTGGPSSSGSTEIQALSNSFGFYSETGMAVSLTQAGQLVGKSKLEVPGLSIVARSRG